MCLGNKNIFAVQLVYHYLNKNCSKDLIGSEVSTLKDIFNNISVDTRNRNQPPPPRRNPMGQNKTLLHREILLQKYSIRCLSEKNKTYNQALADLQDKDS